MASVTVDTREARVFEQDLRKVPGELARHVIPVLKKGAVQIKRQLTEEMRDSKHFKGFANISFDVEMLQGFGGGEAHAIIGPEKNSPGSGANIAYFGTSRKSGKRGGGTVPDPKEALKAETPNFEKALADLVEKLI